MSNLKYLEPATGQPVATDTVGGDFYQLMKVDIGALGSSVPWTGTVVLGPGTANVGTVNAVQSGTYNIGSVSSITNPVAVTGTFWPGTQPVSGTVTANQGGAWNIGTVTSITNSVAVTGAFFPATQPISAVSLPALSGTTAVSIAGNQAVNQTQVNGVAVSVGQGIADTGTQRIALARQTPASTTDISGTLATGGTAQTIAGANANRSSLIVQNTHATAVLRVNPFGAATTTGGLLLNPGIGYEWPFNAIPVGAISVNSTTTGATWYGREGSS